MNRSFLTLLTTSFLVIGVGPAGSCRADEAPPQSTVTIITAAGNEIPFTVELADSERERRRGLMFRKELAPDHGMLFWYSKLRPVGIWMKNTYIPLDILFIDEQGTIVRIAADAVPLSKTVMPSDVPVRAVLEIGGGRAAELGIATGDRVVY